MKGGHCRTRLHEEGPVAHDQVSTGATEREIRRLKVELKTFDVPPPELPAGFPGPGKVALFGVLSRGREDALPCSEPTTGCALACGNKWIRGAANP